MKYYHSRRINNVLLLLLAGFIIHTMKVFQYFRMLLDTAKDMQYGLWEQSILKLWESRILLRLNDKVDTQYYYFIIKIRYFSFDWDNPNES